MAYHREKIGVSRCPDCFAQDVDQFLRFDEKKKEYYCIRCCFSGKPDAIEAFFNEYKKEKYRLMRKPHPFNTEIAGNR